jgi:alkaline phosphatase D
MVVCDIDRNWGVVAVVQGDYDEPRGRELEIADLLSFIKRNAIRNTVRLAANVHCTSARYDPDDAAFQDFDPFSEFVSGPIHAGAYDPNKPTRPSERRSFTNRRGLAGWSALS